jgi:hypothetical protein
VISGDHDLVLEVQTAEELVEMLDFILLSHRGEVACVDQDIAIWNLHMIGPVVRVGNTDYFDPVARFEVDVLLDDFTCLVVQQAVVPLVINIERFGLFGGGLVRMAREVREPRGIEGVEVLIVIGGACWWLHCQF